MAVEELYFQAESLESAHVALEIERKSYQELFDGGPDGLSRYRSAWRHSARQPAGRRPVRHARPTIWSERCCPNLMRAEERVSLMTALAALSRGDWSGEWVGEAVPATGQPFRMALTVAVVRHADGTVYRARWSLRDISRRTLPD